jgi:hypothetical protein
VASPMAAGHRPVWAPASPCGCFQGVPVSSRSPPRQRASSSTVSGAGDPLKARERRRLPFLYFAIAAVEFCRRNPSPPLHHQLIHLAASSALIPRTHWASLRFISPSELVDATLPSLAPARAPPHMPRRRQPTAVSLV